MTDLARLHVGVDNSSSQDYTNPSDQQTKTLTHLHGFRPFTVLVLSVRSDWLLKLAVPNAIYLVKFMHYTRADTGLSKWEGVHQRVRKARAFLGVWGQASLEIFENLSLYNGHILI